MILLAIVLGLLQGVTEFLPISSTAHLLIAAACIGKITTPENSFEVAVQSGSACALLTVFLPKILTIKRSFLIPYIVALIPAVILGALFSSTVKSYLYNHTTFSWSLFLGGLVMIWTEKMKPKALITDIETITPKQGLLVGIAQAVALIPGVSRLGATLVGGRWCGLDRKTAVEFSFLIAIPILFGATGHDLIKQRDLLTMSHLTLMGVGALTAYITGLLVCRPCIQTLIRFGLAPFGWYRIVVGVLFAALHQ